MAVKHSENELKPSNRKEGSIPNPYFYAFCLNLENNIIWGN